MQAGSARPQKGYRCINRNCMIRFGFTVCENRYFWEVYLWESYDSFCGRLLHVCACSRNSA